MKTMDSPLLRIVFQLVLFLFLASGCTPVALNTGATDYARAGIPSEDESYESFVLKYATPSDIDNVIVNEGESISVTLQHVFIKDFSERLERITSKLSLDAVRGEIAILAKVYEQSDGTHIDHTTSGIKKSGRLIYYSEDVRSGGHALNFSQLPIYGPIEYKGSSLVVQITILELDVAESNQLKGILSTLAAMGKRAYAPSSPVLEVLDTISGNLLNGEQDDLELSYSFTLHPNSGHLSVKDAKLVVGNYTLIKQEPIKRPIGPPFDTLNWKNFRLNTNSGRLERNETETAGDVWQDFTDNSYLILQVNTGLPSVGLDVAQAFSELEAELTGEVDNVDFISKLNKSIDDFKNFSSKKSQKEELKKLFNKAMRYLSEFDEAKKPEDKKRALAAYYDIVVSKEGFPKALPASGGTPEFEQYQWEKMIFKMRGLAKEPFKVSKASIRGLGDYAGLESLLK